jgi:hypothetical protein
MWSYSGRCDPCGTCGPLVWLVGGAYRVSGDGRWVCGVFLLYRGTDKILIKRLNLSV